MRKPGIPKFGKPKSDIAQSTRSVRTPHITKGKALATGKKEIPSVVSTAKKGIPSVIPTLKSPKEPNQTKSKSKELNAPALKSHEPKEETKYEEMPTKINPEDFEVWSDYSYDKDSDIDRPENTKSVTCTIEIKSKENKREMIIRKQYYLEDGRELRVKNIMPVRNRPSKE